MEISLPERSGNKFIQTNSTGTKVNYNFKFEYKPDIIIDEVKQLGETDKEILILPKIEDKDLSKFDHYYKKYEGDYALGYESLARFKDFVLVVTSDKNLKFDDNCFSKNSNIRLIVPKNKRLYSVSYNHDNSLVHEQATWFLCADQNLSSFYDNLRDEKTSYEIEEVKEVKNCLRRYELIVDQNRYYNPETNRIQSYQNSEQTQNI